MNTKLQSMLSNFPAVLERATTNDDIRTAVVDLENAVLKSNLEENTEGPYTSREYLVGEPNTRGLSWKLNLLSLVARANFCERMRLGIHGGSTRILGQDENLDVTFQVYDALVAKYEELSKKAFDTFVEGQSKDEKAPTVHRVGWLGKFLIDAPNEVFEAVFRVRDDGANAKTMAMIEKKNEGLAELRNTFTPTRSPATPKPKKAPKIKNIKEAPMDGEPEGDEEPAEMREVEMANAD